MTTKGNMHIKETKKYDSEDRKKITDLILREYKVLKDKDPDGMTFAHHMLKVLTKEGFKAPDGSSLTLRGVRYQVLRSGIGFKGARLIEEQGTAPIVTVENKAAPAVTTEKQEIMQSLFKIPALLERILMDEEVSSSQRVSLVKAWFEVEK